MCLPQRVSVRPFVACSAEYLLIFLCFHLTFPCVCAHTCVGRQYTYVHTSRAHLCDCVEATDQHQVSALFTAADWPVSSGNHPSAALGDIWEIHSGILRRAGDSHLGLPVCATLCPMTHH